MLSLLRETFIDQGPPGPLFGWMRGHPFVACTAALSGCTTAKIASDAGTQVSNGNILTGLYEGAPGVTVGSITDVVTLGGTTTPEQVLKVRHKTVESGLGANTATAGQDLVPRVEPLINGQWKYAGINKCRS
ncbi:hypothetical protein [Paraburkholderia sp.]|uniref:hypothetical protein n=1 Tax=Paraburkholderia sp. TaxID=1926495 RepID=UPI0025DA4CE8|nr:hypothetical protein [Paraburkholderia sp.]